MNLGRAFDLVLVGVAVLVLCSGPVRGGAWFRCGLYGVPATVETVFVPRGSMWLCASGRAEVPWVDSDLRPRGFGRSWVEWRTNVVQ